MAFLVARGAALAQAQCTNPANAIVAENCLPGSPSSEWEVGQGSNGDPTIQGFATDISVNQGGTVDFKINTPAAAYTINIYRLGYYGGMGARKVATVTPSAHLPQTQPPCNSDANTGLTDCGTWAVSASWKVPSSATSGIYIAHLARSDTGGESHIVFIVRNDASHSDIIYQTADESWQAYNYYGSGSLYGQASPFFNLQGRSYKVSYNRPFVTRDFQQEWATWLFGAEFAMIQWLEANGYDVTYSTGVDSDRNGALIKNHKIFMDAGHDEYWTGAQRANVLAARDAGVHIASFSGNTMFWKTRWENSIDGSNTANRTLVCYKETLAFGKIDPSDPPTWTGTFRDRSFSPPADGGQPENSLLGTLFMVNGTGPDNDGSLRIKVPQDDGQMRFWRNTAAARLAAGTSYSLPVGSLGYEWDVDADNGFRPPGAFHLSTVSYPLVENYLLDYGATYGAGTGTHHLMMYRAPSGALVFSAGSVDYAWGLNSNHDNLFSFNTPAPDVNVQQATVNLLADMGVQPRTLASGLTAATASTDVTAPTSSITSPAAGATISAGAPVTVTGTASDTGGVVAGVEFSADGGTTWHPATGRSTWSYSWTPSTLGSSISLLSRAVDDSGNLETPTSPRLVSVVAETCPCSVLQSQTPGTADSGDTGAVELGMKFRSDANISVVGVRFYKSTANTGIHLGHLWSSTGTLLGTVTFTAESSSGWQQANFSSPIVVAPNTTYIISYYAPKGHYAADSFYFAQTGIDNPPIHALQAGVDGQNGVFSYPSGGASGAFPTSSTNASNYWVDLVYTSSNTYAISGSITGAGGAGATVSLSGAETLSTVADTSGNFSFNGVVNGTYTVTVTNTGVTFSPTSRSITVNGQSVTGVSFTAIVTNPLSIGGNISGGAGATVTLSGSASATTTADASGNYTFTGLLNGSYTVTPSASGFLFTPGAQSLTLAGSSRSQVNFAAQVCTCVSIWSSSSVPAVVDSGDSSALEVGVKFRSDIPGTIVGLRFYKANANTGTHTGHLWTSTGTLLGSATFTSETASGWQQVTFASPISILANTTYVASYAAPSGHYSADTGAFASGGVDATPLHALGNGVSGANGVYIYTTSTSGVFPTASYSSTNYWVDVVFASSQSLSVSGNAGASGAVVTLSGSSSAVTTANASGGYSFNVYPGTFQITPSLAQTIFNPGSQNVIVGSTPITGIDFAVPALCPCKTIWSPSTVPATVDSGETVPYELGVKFRADGDGYILGVRFYKSAANTGTHSAHVWSPGTGTPLASATFTDESPSGWQQVLFNSPVPVSANATYIASYFAPSGHYSSNSNFFTSGGVDNAPLHALQSGVDGLNGVYHQASTSVLPTSAYQDSNYWVDVIYATASSYSIGGVLSGAGASGATVKLSGASSASTTVDASGSYRFTGLTNGTYTVTPSQTGYSFSPASQTVTISGAHNLAVNFTSGVPAYTVSGTVTGGTGISVSLSGSTTASTTTDSSGNYTFSSVPNGTYTVTPSGAGYAISPINQSVTVNGANLTGINFAATQQSYSISGSITGGGGATVILSGSSGATATADTSGNYTFAAVAAGSYTITPAKPGLVFTPASSSTVVSGASVQGVNFSVPTGCPCYTVWQPASTPVSVDSNDTHGVELGVKFRSDNAGLVAGIRFYKASTNTGTHIGNLWSSTGTLLASATYTAETSSGWQQVFFANPVAIAANTTYIASYFAPAGHYSSDSGFFASAGVNSPPIHALQNGTDGQNGLYAYGTSSAFPTGSYQSSNYWVDAILQQAYTISGTISGTGGIGATVTLSGAGTATTTASSAGAYTFSGVANGYYTVTPSNSGYSFGPASQALAINGANGVANFTATAATTYTITGTISGAGGSGATVSLGGTSSATTTANATGAYTFSGLANGSYTVTPSKTGYTFSPNSQAVTISGANGVANFISAVNAAFTITGGISGAGGNGAIVILGGASTAATTASSAGTYTFSGLANGAYTVTPSKLGYNFSPPSQAVTINGVSGTANFSSSAATYVITGTISGRGGRRATVRLTGAATASVTSSTSGTYSFTGITNGSYVITPSKLGFTFSPSSSPVTINGAGATVNFAAN
jgi:hypothetical protein